MKNHRVKKISVLFILVSGALFIACAHNAYAAASKDDLNTATVSVTPKIIGSSNSIVPTVNTQTGVTSWPGFVSVGSAGSFMADPTAGITASKLSGALHSSVQASTIPLVSSPAITPGKESGAFVNIAVAPAVSISAMHTAPAAWTANPRTTANLNLYTTATPAAAPIDAKALSINCMSPGLQASIAPVAAGAVNQTQVNIAATVASSLKAISAPGVASPLRINRNDLNKAVLPQAGSQEINMSAKEKLAANKSGVKQDTQAKNMRGGFNAMASHVKQTAAAARMLAKQTHSLTQKTASSVIDGFYAVKNSLSKAKTTALTQIKFAANLKSKAYENASGWIKGIIPIFKMAIPNEELPLLMDLSFIDRNALPAAHTADNKQDPLSPPVRKTVADMDGGDPLLGSATVSRAVLDQIGPKNSIGFIDIHKKNAVNYDRTGLSPPDTASIHSSALLSASNRSIRIFSARLFSIINAHPLSLLVSGGINSKDRGFCLYNNLLTKGGHYV